MTGGGGEEADVGLGGEEEGAAADGFGLAGDVAVAAAAGEDAVVLGGADDAVLGGDDFGVVELARFAHVGEEVVAADVEDVDAGDGGDFLDIVEAFDGFDHQDEEADGVELGDALGERDGAVVEVRVAPDDGAFADGRELADFDGAAGLGGGGDVRVDDAGDAVVEQDGDVGVVDAADADEGGDADGDGGLGDVDEGFRGEDGVLQVHEDEVVAGAFGDAGDVCGAAEADGHAEGGFAGGHAGLHGIDEHGLHRARR